MTDAVTLSATAALVVASWVIGVRIVYKLSRDLSALAQRVAYLEGKLDARSSSTPLDES